MADESTVTRVLRDLSNGDPTASERLSRLVYSELRNIAQALLARENPGHTLQPTALVNEAYMRLVDQAAAGLNDRAHFFAVAAKAMRNVLVDHARRRHAEKRGGGRNRVSAHTALLGVFESSADGVDFLALHEALERLEEINSLTARVVELRYFGGLTIEETAATLGASASSVEREWRFARAWLRDALCAGDTRTCGPDG